MLGANAPFLKSLGANTALPLLGVCRTTTLTCKMTAAFQECTYMAVGQLPAVPLLSLLLLLALLPCWPAVAVAEVVRDVLQCCCTVTPGTVNLSCNHCVACSPCTP